MNWQQAISLIVVAVVAGLFLRGCLRRRKFSFARDTHCGCSSAGPSANKSSIVLHARKGERPAVTVKTGATGHSDRRSCLVAEGTPDLSGRAFDFAGPLPHQCGVPATVSSGARLRRQGKILFSPK